MKGACVNVFAGLFVQYYFLSLSDILRFPQLIIKAENMHEAASLAKQREIQWKVYGHKEEKNTQFFFYLFTLVPFLWVNYIQNSSSSSRVDSRT